MALKNLQIILRKSSLLILFMSLVLLGCANSKSKKEDSKSVIKEQSAIKITPIEHATTVIEFEGKTIYIDPTGGAEAFKDFAKPDVIFITDIHGDHMNMKTLSALDMKETTLITPKAVAEKMSNVEFKELFTLNNGDTKDLGFMSAEAIPMYNLREEALKFHPKGRGNGYILTMNGERIYFSGDTEDIPEMRALKNIDKAFICMNLPYTMTVESAASAVLDFKPKQVYPYHYRGNQGKSDIVKFQSIVESGNKDIEVVQLKWY